MKNEFVWGVPLARAPKKEKYPDIAVLTVEALGKKGTARKFNLNATAITLLGMIVGVDKVTLAFHDGRVFVTKADANMESVKLTKAGTFSNRKFYDYITTFAELDSSCDSEFKLIREELTDTVFLLEQMNNESSPVAEESKTETVERVPEESYNADQQEVELAGADLMYELESNAAEGQDLI